VESRQQILTEMGSQGQPEVKVRRVVRTRPAVWSTVQAGNTWRERRISDAWRRARTRLAGRAEARHGTS